jgi:CHAT domain-containing protein
MYPQRTVLAEYFVTDDKTLLFIIREDFDIPYVIEINNRSLRDIRQFVSEHLSEHRIDEGGREVMKISGQKIRGLVERTFHDFFGPFVTPLVSESPKGDKVTNEGDTIWFVPHDMLHYIPLHAIKIDGNYLIDRNPICYTPSASVMRFCHKKRKGRRENALVVGDSRNDLTFAHEEAFNVAQLFNTEAYLDGRATKSLIKEKLKREGSDLDILHFACHGKFDPDRPLKSHIVLAQENSNIQKNTANVDEEKWNLTAEEIFGIEMHADLATLSACESGVNDRRPGDELIGLTRSLIYSGTPSVIVSLWTVDDLSTSLIMQHFYQELLRKPKENDGHQITKAKALQSALQYARNLTRRQVAEYCNNHLNELNTYVDHVPNSPENMTNVQTITNEKKITIDTYKRTLDAMRMQSQEQDKNIIADNTYNRNLKAIGKEVIGYEANIDHEKPFGHIYYWAPFILVGDWK